MNKTTCFVRVFSFGPSVRNYGCKRAFLYVCCVAVIMMSSARFKTLSLPLSLKQACAPYKTVAKELRVNEVVHMWCSVWVNKCLFGERPFLIAVI